MNRVENAAIERCGRLGDLAATLSASTRPDPAQWAAIETALRPRRRLRWALAIPITAAIALGVFIGSRQVLSHRTDSCSTDPRGTITTPTDRPGTLNFEDGSRFALSPGSTANLRPEGFRRGARLRLHQGRTTVSIVRRLAGQWHVEAGPFNVFVTGTKFAVDWDPAATHFQVRVFEGTVRVSGGPIRGVTQVAAGQSLAVVENARQITWNQAAPEPPRIPAPTPATSPAAITAPRTIPAPAPRAPRKQRLAANRIPAPAPELLPAPAQVEPLTTTPPSAPVPAGHNPSGALFTGIGARGRYLSASAISPTHLYTDNDRRCTHVRIAALACAGDSILNSSQNCDWAHNWGAILGWYPRADRKAWGPSRAKRIAFDFQGPPGLFRLVAHHHGDPPSKVYCVDGYVSGQVVEPTDFRSECWTSGGVALPDFATVDLVALHRPATHVRQTIEMCLKSVNLD